jgi:3-oxoadipate enol-lactonase
MPEITREGATLYYEVHGDAAAPGPAVVFAHGSGGNALAWWQQLPVFAQRHRVVAFDHRGFGRSTCPVAERDPRHFAVDVAAILDAAGAERAALVCQSMGGWTGVGFALAYPDRCAALVLAGTPGGIATPAVARDAAAVPQRMAERGFLGMALGPAFVARDPVKSFLYERLAALNPADTLPAILPKLAGHRVEPERAAAIAAPVLLVVGTEDAFFSVDALDEVAKCLPRAGLEVMDGAGHSAYFEQPDAFNAIVRRFFEEIGAWASSS